MSALRELLDAELPPGLEEVDKLESRVVALQQSMGAIMDKAADWDRQRDQSRTTTVDLEQRKREAVLADREREWNELKAHHARVLEQTHAKWNGELIRVEQSLSQLSAHIESPTHASVAAASSEAAEETVSPVTPTAATATASAAAAVTEAEPSPAEPAEGAQ